MVSEEYMTVKFDGNVVGRRGRDWLLVCGGVWSRGSVVAVLVVGRGGGFGAEDGVHLADGDVGVAEDGVDTVLNTSFACTAVGLQLRASRG